MEAKRRLREWTRDRAPVSPAESRAVVAGLADWLRRSPPSGVLTYLSMEGEVRADELASAEALAAHQFYTTRTPVSGPLTVHPLNVHPLPGELEMHGHGYRQPPEGVPAIADPGAVIGIVLVPGLCFDRSGNRLGRGRGYYDRLLAIVPETHRVAVTLERLIVDRVPTEPHDVAMTHIATERGVVEAVPRRRSP